MENRCLLSLIALSALFAVDVGALQHPAPRCDPYLAAVQADSNDVVAAASLGQCSFRDYEMIAPGGDSTRLMFRSSWSVAVRALRRAVTLDPSNGRAYRPLFAILFAETRDGCSAVTGQCLHVSPVIRAVDSVITVPRLVRLNAVPGASGYEEVIRETHATWRASLAEARALAERWASVAPEDPRPHEYLGNALLRLGDPAAAANELERAAALGTAERRREIFWVRLEALVKADRGADARRVLDDAVNDPERDTTRLHRFTVASLNSLLGRHRPPPVDSARERENRALRGFVRREGPSRPSPARQIAEHLAAGDTVAARRVLVQIDSSVAPRPGVLVFPEVGPGRLELARWHLAVADTVGAEGRLAEMESSFNDRSFRFVVSRMGGSGPPWLGHAWMLAGDLAAARGRPAEAARMYRRIIGLWGGGDPDVEPVVDRARVRLSSLPLR